MSDIFAQGLEVTVIGMAMVFTFLTLLVLSTLGMSRLVKYFAAPPLPLSGRPAQPEPPILPEQEDPRLLAAVSAAVQMHRKRSR